MVYGFTSESKKTSKKLQQSLERTARQAKHPQQPEPLQNNNLSVLHQKAIQRTLERPLNVR